MGFQIHLCSTCSRHFAIELVSWKTPVDISQPGKKTAYDSVRLHYFFQGNWNYKKKRFELNANNNITETGHVHEMVIMVM